MGAGASVNISVIPMGDVDTNIVQYLAQQLEMRFGSCTVGDEMDMPANAYNRWRDQYMASLVVQVLVEAYPLTQTDTKLLGVTHADLYAPGLDCVVGQAEGQCAVLSLRRLHAASESVYRSRILKEATHELGHTMGLRHCEDRLCVMRCLRYVHEIDAKSDRFCGRCVGKLRHIYAGNSMDIAVG